MMTVFEYKFKTQAAGIDSSSQQKALLEQLVRARPNQVSVKLGTMAIRASILAFGLCAPPPHIASRPLPLSPKYYVG